MPFLFQRRYGSEDRPITRSYIRECMVATSQAARSPSQVSRWNGAPMTSGESLSPTPCGPGCHRTSPRRSAATPFSIPPWATPRSTPRRGLPPPGVHRPPPGRRPSEEYRTSPTRMGRFLAHFELRKVALGSAAVTTATPCAHENACVRCPLLRLTQPRCRALKRSTPTSPTGSRRPGPRLARRGRRDRDHPGRRRAETGSHARAHRPQYYRQPGHAQASGARGKDSRPQ